MNATPEKPHRATVPSIDRLSSHLAGSRLDETISALIEAHDNTFQCMAPLLAALEGKFSHVDRFGRTPACLAASLGKKKLAQKIIQLGGGHRVLDIRQMSAEDYLALPDSHFEARTEEGQHIEAYRVEERIEHHRPSPLIKRRTGTEDPESGKT